MQAIIDFMEPMLTYALTRFTNYDITMITNIKRISNFQGN